MSKQEQPRKSVKRSEKAKERSRRRHFKFCRVHSPNRNPHRHRDIYPRFWESTMKYEKGGKPLED